MIKRINNLKKVITKIKKPLQVIFLLDKDKEEVRRKVSEFKKSNKNNDSILFYFDRNQVTEAGK